MGRYLTLLPGQRQNHKPPIDVHVGAGFNPPVLHQFRARYASISLISALGMPRISVPNDVTPSPKY